MVSDRMKPSEYVVIELKFHKSEDAKEKLKEVKGNSLWKFAIR